MKDSQFGELNYTYGWEGRYSYSIFGKTYSVKLVISCYDGNEIKPAQREAFTRFDLAKDRLIELAAHAIYDYYLEIADEIRERVGPDFADEFAPAIEKIDDLANLVTPTHFFIQHPFENKRIIGLLFNCIWEPSLGLAVKFEDEILVEVGTQDIVL